MLNVTKFAMFLFTGDASPSNLHLNSHWRYLPGNEKNDEPKYVILDYIKHILPKAKIIIVFRDPIERFVYSQTCLKRPFKERPNSLFKTDIRLMQVKSIAECSMGALCNTFDLH